MKNKLQAVLTHKLHPVMFAGCCLLLVLVVVLSARSTAKIEAFLDGAFETVHIPGLAH